MATGGGVNLSKTEVRWNGEIFRRQVEAQAASTSHNRQQTQPLKQSSNMRLSLLTPVPKKKKRAVQLPWHGHRQLNCRTCAKPRSSVDSVILIFRPTPENGSVKSLQIMQQYCSPGG